MKKNQHLTTKLLPVLFVLFCAGSLYAADDVWGKWGLEGDGADQSGNGNNVEMHGAAVAKGIHEKCLAFGNNDYLECAATPKPTAKLTIEACVKAPSQISINPYFAGNARGEKGFGLYVDSGTKTFQFVCYIGNKRVFVGSTTTILENAWQYVVGTYDGAQACIYVNGSLENTISVTGDIGNSEYPFCIGCRQPGIGQCAGWLIDEVSLSYSAKSTENIKETAKAYGLANTN